MTTTPPLRPSVAALLASALLLAPASTQPPAADLQPVPPPLAATLPDLADQSSWAQNVAYEGARPDKRMRGVYAVGNGHVFGYMGLGARANTLQAITGPHYQTDEEFAPRGHFGELTLDLLRDGEPVALPQQRVRRVRGANFVVTEDAAPGGLALRTLTFATPQQQHLTRVVQVVNTGAAAIAKVVLRLTPEATTRVRGDALQADYVSEMRPGIAYFELSGARADGAGLLADVGELGAGNSWTGVLTVSTTTGPEAPAEWAPVPAELERATADAVATLAWWKAKLASTSDFDTDHRKLADLVRDQKVSMLVQRCAQAGAVAPMINYRGVWVRDSIGPMLTFLRFGMWDEARATLKYIYNATRLLNRVPNHVPLDLDFSLLRDRRTDWSKVEVPASEVPSWIILQHHWYWRATRDISLISEHWPLLDACLKKQERGPDTLMKFHGDEPFLRGALYSLYPDRVKDVSGFIADDRWHGRRAWSFASAVEFLMAVQSMGEMVDGLDKATHPDRWAQGDPDNPPREPYYMRALEIRDQIEERYWLEDEKIFAPALSPVTLAPHRAPFANINLMPLWVGWTNPRGEKSRDNLRNSLAMLWRRGARIGTTPTVGYATGDLQGMLLTALSERDGVARLDCLDEVLRMAEPAGEWGELYDPDGRPVYAYDPQWPNRLRPFESGVNLEAIMFAISGIRFTIIPYWDDTAIRLKLRMPHGAEYVTMKNVDKDARRIHVYMNAYRAKLDPEELEDNARKIPEKRLDPDVAHRRLRFRVDLVSDDPPKGYWDMALNALNTVFVSRFLLKERPLDEAMLWNYDTLEFFPKEGQGQAWKHVPLLKKDGATLVVFTARDAGARIGASAETTTVDTGLPMRATDLANMLVTPEGALVHDRVYLDRGWNAADRTTFKTEDFWNDPVIADAWSRFAAAGGVVLEPGYFGSYEIESDGAWRTIEATDGELTLPPGTRAARARVSSNAPREVVLRLGSGGGLAVSLNGEEVFARTGGRQPRADADAVLVRLREGDNDLEFTLSGEGDPVLFARVSDSQGLPVAGVLTP